MAQQLLFQPFQNPFRPGAGQLPPHLAGRTAQIEYFERNILYQDPVLSNLLISGLRGVGKTVLLDTLRPVAVNNGWIWAGTDLSESVSVSEKNLSLRIMTDLASAVSSIPIQQKEIKEMGFSNKTATNTTFITGELLKNVYDTTFGLEADKLKKVFEYTWNNVKHAAKGVVLAYDEAQNLTDKAEDKQYPLSLLLEVISFLQKSNTPYLLTLTGLPTLFSNLVEARTYSERMFHQMILTKLSKEESKEAIVVPIQKDNCPVRLSDEFIEEIIKNSGGYPYFIQYLCKEVYDSYLQQVAMGNKHPTIKFDSIIRKLDTDFYQGRWGKVTDRQKDLLIIISKLQNAEEEFTAKEIIEESKKTDEPFKSSSLSIMLSALISAGLIYKNRHGRYSFAVPMFSKFIKREIEE